MNDGRVVITGGSGFVGTNLVEYLSQCGWEVQNFDVASPRNSDHLQYWTKVDILNRKQLIAETQKFQPTVFLHFAARTDLDEKQNLAGYTANIEGVSNVVEAIRSTHAIQRAIFASSQLVCELGYQPQNEYDYRPSTLYGQSKVITERIVRTAENFNVIWTIVRPTSLWGPWFDVPYKNFFLTIARNLYVHPGTVHTLKQWGFVGNSVFQVYRLIEAPPEKVKKRTFYLADYQPIELRDFADKVQAVVGAKPIKTIPSPLLRIAALLGDLGSKIGWANPPLTSFRYSNMVAMETQDLRQLQEVIGPLPYSIDQGIEITVQWLRQHDKRIRAN
ncbi:MAG TPA: NAD(P)-dependent oxidoreductase [Anaerolineales bacterium]|nr:NAD(P)-dependent oxidoreductase [Anaerolineales bacterium]